MPFRHRRYRNCSNILENWTETSCKTGENTFYCSIIEHESVYATRVGFMLIPRNRRTMNHSNARFTWLPFGYVPFVIGHVNCFVYVFCCCCCSYEVELLELSTGAWAIAFIEYKIALVLIMKSSLGEKLMHRREFTICLPELSEVRIWFLNTSSLWSPQFWS